jgi:hypothetical protein
MRFKSVFLIILEIEDVGGAAGRHVHYNRPEVGL